jgi:hypothetical protein
MSRNNWYFWEAEQGVAQTAPATTPDTPGGLGAPGQAGGATQPQTQPQQKPPQTEDPNKPKDKQDPDITQDPQHPDMNDHGGGMEDKDFEEWRSDYFELAIKGDTEEMLRSLKEMRERDLDPTQRKFVEDNIQIMFLREDSNIERASKEIRKLVKDSLDENFPATSAMQHICASLDKFPMLNNVFFKLLGTFGMKGDLHRKFLASLLCAVQTGGGGSREDIVYSEKDYSIDISTRFSTEWGEMGLGKWALKADDPQRYLEEPEVARLKDGAPEERTVLRHRIVLASIADQFAKRSFLIHVANADGTIHAMGWDVGDSIKSGYVDGKLVVRTKTGDSAEAMIDDDGNVIPITDLHVKFVKETGKTDDTGKPMKREYPFMERINGMLYFTAGVNTIRAMADAMSGVFFKEIPYNGNPSDIKRLMQAVPTVDEILLRKQ